MKAKAGNGRRTGAVLLLLGAVVVALDQASKTWIVAAMREGGSIDLVGSAIRLYLTRNSGAAFSFATDATPLLSLLAAAVVVALIWFARRVADMWWALGLGLVLGGAAGNLVDRLLRAPGFLHGHVVDFISVGSFPIFNLADSALTVGVVVIAVAVMRGKEPTSSEQPVA